MKERLSGILKELWENDDHVPATQNYRCTGLDWFSQGVKDNVVAYIAVKMLGIEKASALLGETLHEEEL